MSDLMLHGVLNMPLPDDPSKIDLVTWVQFKDRATQASSRIEELEAKLSESEALLEKAEVEKLDAIDTLDAWFDRRKLAHDAIDQAVVDAASGYLRTSRVGGMSQKKSDLVLGVIQDMARLSVFADLFARTTIAAVAEPHKLTSSEAANGEAKGGKDE